MKPSPGNAEPARGPAPSVLLSRLARHTPAIVAGVGLGSTVLAGAVLGPSGVILGLSGTTLVAAIALFWSSLRTLVGDERITASGAIAVGAAAASDEQKRIVLRALREIDHDHRMGTLDDEDHAEMLEKHRANAEKLLEREAASGPSARERAEELLDARLRELGLAPSAEDKPAESTPGGAKKRASKRPPAKAAATLAKAEAAVEAAPAKVEPAVEAPAAKAAAKPCAACSADNDEDAMFCKRCGKPLGQPEGGAS